MIIDQISLNNTAPESTIEQSPAAAAYRRAAAVLAAIENPESLRPESGTWSPGEGARLLKRELVSVVSKKLEGTVTLNHESRRKTLGELKSRSAMLKALQANPLERGGAIQKRLEYFLNQDTVKIEEIPDSELQESLQVLLWLEGILDGLPSSDEVRRRLSKYNLMRPFESLAGDAFYRGRQSEMDDLRSYVGVVAPEGLLSRMINGVISWVKPTAQPAISVWGPGGVGKSALIARFVLEHSRVPDTARIPYAYLDFDNPALTVSDPTGLVLEMLRQLDLEFPQEDSFRNLWEFLSKELGKLGAPGDREPDYEANLQRALSVLADLLGSMEYKLGPRPFLLILDTFEEEQYRGEQRAFPFWELLGRLQAARPFLRVVISGRAPVTSLELAGQKPVPIELKDLDSTASIAFLEAQGITNRGLASALVKQVGGVPLSLKLVAALAKSEQTDKKGVRDLRGKSLFWISASDEVIQGQLYERILDHIHNTQVARLAHPGLVLRQLTPEVIFYILREPCQLTIETIEEARELFNELRKETSLVTYDDQEGALVHRSDLRRMMLKLLVQKAPVQVREIRERAEAWYRSQRGKRAKAEALYHRLQLGESIDEQDVQDSDIRGSLQASMAEFPIKAQVELASYGLKVDDSVLKHATQEQSEAHVAATIEDLLPYSPNSLSQASEMLENAGHPDHDSPLFRARARIAAQRKRGNPVAELDEGLQLAAAVGNTFRTLQYLVEKAWLAEARHRPDDLVEVLPLLKEYAERHDDKAALIQFHAQRGRLAERHKDERTLEACLQEINSLMPHIGPETLYGIWIVFRGLWKRGGNAASSVACSILEKVLDDDSPFTFVEFGAGRADRALAKLVEVAYEAQKNEYADLAWRSESEGDEFVEAHRRSSDSLEQVAEAIDGLAKGWPYEVLNVKPRDTLRRRQLHVSK
jgi:hypothetical protein